MDDFARHLALRRSETEGDCFLRPAERREARGSILLAAHGSISSMSSLARLQFDAIRASVACTSSAAILMCDEDDLGPDGPSVHVGTSPRWFWRRTSCVVCVSTICTPTASATCLADFWPLNPVICGSET